MCVKAKLNPGASPLGRLEISDDSGRITGNPETIPRQAWHFLKLTCDLEKKGEVRKQTRKEIVEKSSEELEDFVLAAEISKGADVGNDEGGRETIFNADGAEVDAAVFEGEAAAAAVVTDLN